MILKTKVKIQVITLEKTPKIDKETTAETMMKTMKMTLTTATDSAKFFQLDKTNIRQPLNSTTNKIHLT